VRAIIACAARAHGCNDSGRVVGDPDIGQKRLPGNRSSLIGQRLPITVKFVGKPYPVNRG